MKGKILRKVFIPAVTAIVLGVTLVGCASQSDNADNTQFSFDPAESPSNIKEVVYLKGTPEEMGIQYGKQAKDSLERTVAYKKSKALENFDSEKEMYAELEAYEKIYEENIPDVVEMWKGMSESSGISYEDILVAYTQFYINPHRTCSTVSMWGDATADGKIIAGTNYDLTLEPYTYEPAVIAFPKGKNSFIAASGLIGGSYMNEQGLIIMGSQGQDANAEDLGKAVAPKVGLLQLAMDCNTAEEAKDMYIDKLAPGSGENLHVIDTEKNNFIVEHTMAKDTVRSSGDFDEKDYMIATNTFLTDEMQDCLYKGDEFWDDALPRYWTEEKIIQDNQGSNTIDTLNDAIGSTSYYADENWLSDVYDKGEYVGYKKIENGVWVEDNWDISDDYTGFWTPENREVATKCIARTIAIPEDMTMYVMAGCRDTLVSDIPNATGNFWKLSLTKSPKSTTGEAQSYAQIQIWLGARDISNAEGDTNEREADLNTAKEALYEGMNYMNLAGCEKDKDVALEYYSKATTAFCKAQCYAQLAQNDPTKLQREGENYEVY